MQTASRCRLSLHSARSQIRLLQTGSLRSAEDNSKGENSKKMLHEKHCLLTTTDLGSSRVERDVTNDLEREFARPKKQSFLKSGPPRPRGQVGADPALMGAKAVRDYQEGKGGSLSEVSRGHFRDGRLARAAQETRSNNSSTEQVASQEAPIRNKARESQGMAAQRSTVGSQQGIRDLRSMAASRSAQQRPRSEEGPRLVNASPSAGDIQNMAAKPSPTRPQQGARDLRNMSAAPAKTMDLRAMRAAAPSSGVTRSPLRISRVASGSLTGSVQERASRPPRTGSRGVTVNESGEIIGDRSTLRREQRSRRKRSLLEGSEAKAEGPQYSEAEQAYINDREAALVPRETPYVPVPVTLESLAEYMPSLSTNATALQSTVQHGFERMLFNASLGSRVKAPPMEFLSLEEARQHDAKVAKVEGPRDSFETKPLTNEQMDTLLGKLLPEVPDVAEQTKKLGAGQVVARILEQVNRNPSYTGKDSVAFARRYKSLLPGTTPARPAARA